MPVPLVDSAPAIAAPQAGAQRPPVRSSRWSPGRISAAVSRRLRRAYRTAIAPLAGRGRQSGLCAAAYYLLTAKFSREQRAVLAGQRLFQEIAEAPAHTCSLLRRNTHRLEKGLLMRPRRSVFALDYIQETVECYERVHRDSAALNDYDRGELKWAHDVLASYFDVTGSHPLIDTLRTRFRALPGLQAPAATPLVPYRRELAAPLSIAYDDLVALAHRRRSVRWFLQQRVPRDLIEKAVLVAAQSPSACNRQPFVFRIFDDPELAHRVGAIPAGTAGFSENFPAVVVVVGQQRHYFDERDRHVIYIDGALASMSFVYALETLGLSSCCINWPDIEEREQAMAEFLGLEPDERPIMLIAVGYPDPEGLVACSQKKSLSQLCRFNFE
jgi:nitroreductase